MSNRTALRPGQPLAAEGKTMDQSELIEAVLRAATWIGDGANARPSTMMAALVEATALYGTLIAKPGMASGLLHAAAERLHSRALIAARNDCKLVTPQ